MPHPEIVKPRRVIRYKPVADLLCFNLPEAILMADRKSPPDFGWLPTGCHKRVIAGFNLADLLISLAILGVIATFTIPKIVISQQNTSYKANAKQLIGALATAYQQHKFLGRASASTRPSDLFQYLNHIKYDTTSYIDVYPNSGAASSHCAARPCAFFSNGAALAADWSTLGGTGTTNAMMFYIDPDSQLGSRNTIAVFVYCDGSIREFSSLLPGTVVGGGGWPGGPSLGAKPNWFSW